MARTAYAHYIVSACEVNMLCVAGSYGALLHNGTCDSEYYCLDSCVSGIGDLHGTGYHADGGLRRFDSLLYVSGLRSSRSGSCKYCDAT